MNLLTAVVLLGCAAYVLYVAFSLLCRMDKRTPFFLGLRVALAASAGVYGVLSGLIAILELRGVSFVQIATLAAIAVLFATHPRINTEPRCHDRTRIPH